MSFKRCKVRERNQCLCREKPRIVVSGRPASYRREGKVYLPDHGTLKEVKSLDELRRILNE